jgi:hypothetical protein
MPSVKGFLNEAWGAVEAVMRAGSSRPEERNQAESSGIDAGTGNGSR